MSRRIGSHVVRVEEDVVTLHLRGDLPVDDMRAITAALDEVIARHGRIGVVGDLRELGTVPPDSRRFASGWSNVDFTYGTACFGGNFALRTLISLLSRAIELIRKRANHGELAFFKTEEEARAWLHKQRERLRAQK